MNGAKHRFALGLTCFFLIGITVVYPFLLYLSLIHISSPRDH